MLDGPKSDIRTSGFRRCARAAWRLMLYVILIVICREIALSVTAQNTPQRKSPVVHVAVKPEPRKSSNLTLETHESLFRDTRIGQWNSLTSLQPSTDTTARSTEVRNNAVPDVDRIDRRQRQPMLMIDSSTDGTVTQARAEESHFFAPIAFDNTGRARLPERPARSNSNIRPASAKTASPKTTPPRRLHLPSRVPTPAAAPLQKVGHAQDDDSRMPAEDGVVYPESAVAPDQILVSPPSPGVIGAEPGTLQLPLVGEEDPGEVNLAQDGEMLALSFREAPLREVLGVLAESQGLNLICASAVNSKITGNFHSISFEDAMNTVVSVSGHTWTRRNNVIIVTSMTNELKLAPEAQGRQVRVFTLNYLSAIDVQKACTGLLSPSGTIVATESDPADSHKTREQLMVEDLPDYIDRIAELICQIDIEPQQVLIEAHILQVDLKNNQTHGVDFAKLGSIAGTKILVGTPSFNGTVTDLSTFASPSYNIGIFNSGSFSGLIAALQKTTDAKTLASPKVLALNGQEAHVQIGKRLGYHVTTTTQTSTLQSVQFLDTGVVLTVTPRITIDNQIMLTVKPEVSDGAIDALGLPSTTTTEVQTNILLPDGKGMVIGGLIKETDVTEQQKIPVLGSLWLIGKLFRRNTVTRERSEIIIALIPHIVGGPHFDGCQEEQQIQQATTPLLHGPLEPVVRPWEPKLPDAIENPRRLDKSRTPELWKSPSAGPPHHLDYYFPADGSYSGDTMIFESIPVYQPESYPMEYAPQSSHPTEDYEYDEPQAGDGTSASSR